MRPSREHSLRHIRNDFLLIVISVLVAWLIVRLDLLRPVLVATENIKLLSSFIAGLFFTSAFTTPLSMVALGEISLNAPSFAVAFFGASGAVIGDMIIFLFVKDRFAEDVRFLTQSSRLKRIKAIFELRLFRWLTPMIGALIIASPLPDELGLAMMGMAKLRTLALVCISFTMNFIGIILIALAANAL